MALESPAVTAAKKKLADDAARKLVTIYDEQGKPFGPLEPVDAKESIATGRYFAEPPGAKHEHAKEEAKASDVSKPEEGSKEPAAAAKPAAAKAVG